MFFLRDFDALINGIYGLVCEIYSIRAYVPRGVGKTRALMGATRPPSGMASWGQMRTAHQTMKYTPVFPMLP